MNWIAVIIISFVNIIAVFLSAYLSRKGHNKADKEDVKEISMQSELGKNLATKQDISEITQKIEIIKNEVSFENQRKHSFINERHLRFIKILSLAEELKSSEMELFYLMYNTNGLSEITKLISHINKIAADIVHEGRILMVNLDNDNVNKTIQTLVKSSQNYSFYLCVVASNATTYLSNWRSYLELAEKNENNASLLKASIENQDNLTQLRADFEEQSPKEWELHYANIIKYLSLLRKLYSIDFHLRYELTHKNNHDSLRDDKTEHL